MKLSELFLKGLQSPRAQQRHTASLVQWHCLDHSHRYGALITALRKHREERAQNDCTL